MPLARLPLWILYRFSDALFFVLYYVGRYRKRVVIENIRKSFPQKSASEVEAIAREFFRHLCDLIFESIKGCAISREEVLTRHCYTNPELLEAYRRQGKSLTIVGAHYANWEWVALSLPLVTGFKTHGIFQKINNEFLNGAVKRSRERHGMRLVAKKELVDVLEASNAAKELITMGYIGDQSPARTGRKHWMNFLNQDTAVTSGFEHFAKQYDTPVLYLSILKKGRGRYEGTFHPITDAPRATAEGQIVEQFMGMLEKIIREEPAYWLWSHRRWKLRREDGSAASAGTAQ